MFCFILLPSGGQMRNKRAREKASGTGVTSSAPPSIRPLPISALHLSVFLSDSCQPVGYSGHASIPRCIHLPTDSRKHVLVRVALLYRAAAASRGSRYCPRSMAAIKTCNRTFPEKESSGTHSGTRPHHKIKHLSRGPFSRSLKNNYMWTDSKF